METMTIARARRTYITDVHNSLAKKIGKEGADTLTNYLEDTIPAQIEDKIQYLATKEDVAKVRTELANVELKLSGDIANVRTELANVELKLSGDIANVRTELANVELKLSGDIANVRAEVANVSANLTKWMLATIITIALGALALYFKK